jgi:lipid-binding SYLF domain-containing protein
MNTLQTLFLSLVVIGITFASGDLHAATPEGLMKDSNQALATLIKSNPTAANISKQAKAILIFPNIVKAGLVFGGAYGEGVLLKDNQMDGYFNSISASFGWQAGAQSYGYIVFLISDAAIESARATRGWEIGVGPTVVVVNEGIAKNISTSTLREDAYAFIFDQQGIMASLSIEGTKISRIEKK